MRSPRVFGEAFEDLKGIDWKTGMAGGVWNIEIRGWVDDSY
jgi:hypothetical protein